MKHTSYHSIGHFIRGGRDFTQLLPFAHIVPLVLPLNSSGRNFCHFAIVVGYHHHGLLSYKAALLSYTAFVLFAITIHVAHAVVAGAFAPTAKGLTRNTLCGGNLQKVLQFYLL